MESGDTPDLPARPKTAEKATPPVVPTASKAEIEAQDRMLKEYADQQEALRAAREAEERRRLELEAQQQREFEERQRAQAEKERLAQEQLQQQLMMQSYNAAAQQQGQLEQELLAMRGQYERDQLLLEQYDRVRLPSFLSLSLILTKRLQRVKALEGELVGVTSHINSQMGSKDELIKQLQDQVTLWRNKYEALAKLYSQLRTEHLDMLSKFKQLQLKANSAQEAVDRMERMERDLKAKNLELADMIRERDRARFDVDRQKGSHKDEMDRLRRELDFAKEREQDAIRSKSNQVSGVLTRYERQISELEESLRVRPRRNDLRDNDSFSSISRPNKFRSMTFSSS
jgi:huntingtin-interacting protein 1-related protein